VIVEVVQQAGGEQAERVQPLSLGQFLARLHEFLRLPCHEAPQRLNLPAETLGRHPCAKGQRRGDRDSRQEDPQTDAFGRGLRCG
jgi:hypothetical protein